MPGYTKLFGTLIGSTVWRESDQTRIVWITLLALADRNGIASASIPGLADYARVTIEQAEAAIAKFLAPDPYSRSPENDGRRVELVDGGWRIVNYEKYRYLRDDYERRDYMRSYMRQRRRSGNPVNSVNSLPDLRQSVNSVSNVSSVNSSKPRKPRLAKAKAKAEAELGAIIGSTSLVANQKASLLERESALAKKPQAAAPAKSGRRLPEDFAVTDEHRDFACKYHLPDPNTEIDAFKDYFRAKTGKDASRLDWDATFRNWLRKAVEFHVFHKTQRSDSGRERLLTAMHGESKGPMAD